MSESIVADPLTSQSTDGAAGFADEHGRHPLRGELLSVEHLRLQAIELANSLTVVDNVARDRRFHRKIKRNATSLQNAYRTISRAIREGEPLSPEAEWLLDNFYAVEENLRQIRDDLPRSYFDELPKLADRTPRIYHVALDLIVHTDSVVQQDDLTAFVEEFQTVAPLSIGETWALPIMLRLALVENLRRLARQMLINLQIRQGLHSILDQWRIGDPVPDVLDTETLRPDLVANAFTVLGDLYSNDPQRFAALEQLLMERFPSSTELIRAEHRRQASNQVSIGNVISSMRLISALDWMKFFERTNLSERILQQDPAGVYSLMDPESRNRYRHALEELAKGSGQSDLNVARRVLHLAQTASGDKWPTAISNHVGYWLVDDGRPEFERSLGYRPKQKKILSRWMLSHPGLAYFGAIVAVCSLGLMLCGGFAVAAGLTVLSRLILLTTAIFPLSEFAILLVNWFMTLAVPPRRLAKMEFKDGVPEQFRTFVIVPAMLTGRKEIAALLDRLELHYVANSEPELRFALLTDFTDAPHEQLDSDAALVEQAVLGIQKLNQNYGVDGHRPFFLFHRRRQWNERESVWMGWERKRGKLMEFNQLLCGNTGTSYSVIEGDMSDLKQSGNDPAFPYVITLDADTQLPLGAARRLIGTLAHPLNRPQLDPDQTRVVRGYTILQPRVSVQLSDGNKSRFTQLFANGKGIDPYATAASDVYQDLFGEGSFTGKGIYDVRSFETLLQQRFDENRILSHDLIEGCHTRVGLVSDVEVIDGYPARYDADARRNHRWVRGDWQIALWLLRNVPCQGGTQPNRLSILSRWKILDNLRRSIVAPGTCLFLLSSWFLAPNFAGVWGLLAWLSVGFPVVTGLVTALVTVPRWELWISHARAMRADLLRSILQTFVLVACLPHKAYLMLDAVVRTLIRIAITHRKMLEWETAASAERRLAKSSLSIVREMAFVPVSAVVVAIALPTAAWTAAAPWLLAWLLSPAIAFWISTPIRRRELALSTEEIDWLRLLARSSWSYFESTVGVKTNWLPPDNLQEHPEEKLAERISPTNEGLYLVSLLVARDFGFVGLHTLVDLCEKNLATWRGLPQLNGHHFNWYDTATLQPLMPRYVSTVDSGNLAASLLVVERGVDDLCRSPVFGESVWRGLNDTLILAIRACDRLQPRGARMISPPLDELTALLNRQSGLLNAFPKTWEERHAVAESLRSFRRELDPRLQDLVKSHRHPTDDVESNVRSLMACLDGLDADWKRLAPWVSVAIEITHAFEDATPGDVAKNAWLKIREGLDDAQSVEQLLQLPAKIAKELHTLETLTNGRDAASDWGREMAGRVSTLMSEIEAGAASANALNSRFRAIGRLTEQMSLGMDFDFLFNPERRLFAIGFNAEDGKLDRSHYDMLCSEARLTSQLAIAKVDVPYDHWFHLGRQMTVAAGQPGLLSWGGTMFEFLMPLLFQRNVTGSLLSQACETAVARQREYGREGGVPWGISESAFAAMAINSDYNYRSFGVPGLGLKRGLSDDMVIAPYATMLALAIAPSPAVANLRRLASEGALGRFGFYDAIDYSPARVPPGRKALPVRCYMAHHQAMGISAIANVLLDRIIVRRFHSHPIIRASEMLLQESVPTVAPVLLPHTDETAEVRAAAPAQAMVSRRLTGYETLVPRTHLLSNGVYSVMVTNTGGGYSQSGGIAVNRWRGDGLKDCGGQFLFIRNCRTGQVWSATFQPTCKKPDFYEVIYSIDKAEYRRSDGDIESHLEIAVSPDQNVEHRQLKLTNRGSRPCELEITSYVEVVLIPQAADLAHPAFQKLFIETEYLAEETALVAKRRPREHNGETMWAIHVLASTDVANEDIQYESSRMEFLGRGRDLRTPAAMEPDARLSGTVGAVLDPIFSLRCRVTVPGNSSVTIALTTGTATSREEALRLSDQFHEPRSVLRAFELAWVFNQVQLHHLHLTAAKAQRFQQLASFILFPHLKTRGSELALRTGGGAQSRLWRFGISGDRPILLVNVEEAEHAEFVREMLLAHQYWEHHGLTVDLVILNTHPGSYLDLLQEILEQIVREAPHLLGEARNSVFLLRAAQFPPEDRWLLEASASTVIEARRGWLTILPSSGKSGERYGEKNVHDPASGNSIANGEASTHRIEAVSRLDFGFDAASSGERTSPPPQRSSHALQLEFWNGFGGFAAEGREYHIQLRSSVPTPAPWSNVIANPRFGCLVTETGGGYTWAENSRQNKLTGWSNDPVTDLPSEILYFRDDEANETWLPLATRPQPTEEAWAHHGQGYSRFVRSDRRLDQEVLISIAPDDPVKFVVVKIHNRGRTERQLSVTYYADFVLGVNREQTGMHLMTELDASSGALLIRNSYHPTCPNQVVFLQAIGPRRSCSGDRAGFLGRNGDLRNPPGLKGQMLTGTTGVGLDPCGAVQTRLVVKSGETAEIAFVLGCGADLAESQRLLNTHDSVASIQAVIERTIASWNGMLETIQVKTPNRALDILVNRWLLYQVISCRMWGRSAFYQSGGAYGFRDQLQDAMSLVLCRPDLTREQLLRAAAHQFEEGDVQHWWHPPLGEGTRTRFSDDLLWLPCVVAQYVHATGDRRVLEELVPYLHSAPLAPDEQERYEQPQVSSEVGSLYEHCIRALERGFRLGEHGLPLMGCGDWNDGMNHVGIEGRGESVWVGWFLLKLIDDFVPLMESNGDMDRAVQYRERAMQLRNSMERHAWDGEWYRRAFFDNGTPLGSRENDECQIDSIVQSWAVLANADSERTDRALAEAFKRLVSVDERLVTLFAPPFDRTLLDPGYVKGYLPGVRENGGQYTHAVLWLIQALAIKGDGERAMTIFDYINPILHARNPDEVLKYRVEPYVIAADVYSVSPHAGRGGWTWYTGSAAWAYRTALESILGVTVSGSQLRIAPCVPADWEQFSISIRRGSTKWHFSIEIANDGSPCDADNRNEYPNPESIHLVEDGLEHHQSIRCHAISKKPEFPDAVGKGEPQSG